MSCSIASISVFIYFHAVHTSGGCRLQYYSLTCLLLSGCGTVENVWGPEEEEEEDNCHRDINGRTYSAERQRRHELDRCTVMTDMYFTHGGLIGDGGGTAGGIYVQ